MAFTQRLQQKLKTGIALTPQVQLTIELIQKTKLELVAVVQQELEGNPALELKEDADPETQAAEIEAAERQSDRGAGADESQDDWETGDWERYQDYLQSPSGPRGAVEVGRAAPIDNTLANSESLADHLNSQIGIRVDNELEIEVCGAIIGCLNEAGYLEATLEEIQALGDGVWSIADIERSLAHVQSLEPYGVGARDVRECWLLQIPQSPLKDGIAEVLVRNHFDTIELKQFDDLAKKLSVSVDEIRNALALINRLDSEPGLTLIPIKTEYLVPDVRVSKADGTYQVEFIDEGMPRVRVNPEFSKVRKNVPESYRKERLGSAKTLLKSIDQRKLTILKVARSIVQYQEEFMDRGVISLRPLVLREIAEEIDMHESTVSRVVHNKSIDTPQGVFEMKYFFPSRIPCRNGADVSSVVVKLKIGDIIKNESPRRPLSDSKIHAVLQGHGYDLARRTVAKYRDELQLPIASVRKDLSM